MKAIEIAVAILLSGHALTAQRLTDPIRSVDTPIPQGQASKWSGGVLLVWRTTTSASDLGDNLFIYDIKRGVHRGYRLGFPDAAIVHIWDVASTAGTVAAAGQAMSAEGRFVGFFVLASAQDRGVNVVQTSPFEPQRIVFGSDATLWVLGSQLGEGRRIRTAPPHAVLRHYAADGRVIGEHLQWPAIACGLHPAINHGEGNPALTTFADGVGVMLPACHEWLELDSEGNVARKVVWRYPSQKDNWLMFTASTPHHAVFGYMGGHLFQLDRDNGDWKPVLQSDSTPASATLLGSDGEALVYLSRGRIQWATVNP